MSEPDAYAELVSLDTEGPIWERFFSVAPLVVIGSREESGAYDLAPKHMAGPMGWQDFFGFVCSPRHSTCINVLREKAFTVSYPRADQVVFASLAASPRCEDGSKAMIDALPTFPARRIDGLFLRDANVCLECTLHRVVDDLGPNSLILGRVVAAYAHRDAVRADGLADRDVLARRPVLVYLHPGRFARVRRSRQFPLPSGFKL